MFVSLHFQEQWDNLDLLKSAFWLWTGPFFGATGLLWRILLLAASGLFCAGTPCSPLWALLSCAKVCSEFCLNDFLGFEVFPGCPFLNSLLEVLLLSWLGELFYCVGWRLSQCPFLKSKCPFHMALFPFFNNIFSVFFPIMIKTHAFSVNGGQAYSTMNCGLQCPLLFQIFSSGRCQLN